MGLFNKTEEEKAQAQAARAERKEAKETAKAEKKAAEIAKWETIATETGATKKAMDFDLLYNCKEYGLIITEDGYAMDKEDPRIKVVMADARASVETEGEITSRFTATRILAVGVFALAFKKKKDKREVFMVVESGDTVIVSDPISPKKRDDARKWARKFNGTAAQFAENRADALAGQ